MTAPVGPFEARALADLRAELRRAEEVAAVLLREADRAAAEARAAEEAANRAELEAVQAMRRAMWLRLRIGRLERAGARQ